MKLGFLPHLLCLTISTQFSGQTRQVEPVRLDSGTTGLLATVHLLDERIGFAVGRSKEEDATVLLRTADGGRTWQTLFDTRAGGLSSLSFPSERVGYAFGERGVILKISPGDNGR